MNSYAPSDIAPDIEWLDARFGYREGVRTRGRRREVFVQESRVGARRVAVLEKIPGLTPQTVGRVNSVVNGLQELASATRLLFWGCRRAAQGYRNGSQMPGDDGDGQAVRSDVLACAKHP